MAAPTLAKSWHTRGEMPAPDTASLIGKTRSELWLLAAQLTGNVASGVTGGGSRAPASVWTVSGSSNGVAAGMDSVDRWNLASYTAGNLVRAPSGSAHSWIVLTNTTLGVHLLLSLASSSDTNVVRTFARTPFTGGSVTTDPTSTTSVAIGTTTVGTQVANAAAADTVLGGAEFGLMSVGPSGEFVWVWHRATQTVFSLFFGLVNLVDQRAGDTWPTVALYQAILSGRGSGQAQQVAAISGGCSLRNKDGAARQASGGIGVLYPGNSSAFPGVAQLDSSLLAHNVLDVRIDSLTDVSNQGYRGRIQDLWIVGNITVGKQDPTVGPDKIIVGDFLVPCHVTPSLS